MASNDEELQAKEFLQRAEVKTMRKDLHKMREADALKERSKIVDLSKNQNKKIVETQKIKAEEENAVQKVFLKKTNEELEAEKQLKTYANEEEKQKIFLLENSAKEIENEIQKARKEKEPSLALEKNELILSKKQWDEKNNSILKEEKIIEEDQNFISEKEKTTRDPLEKENLEKKRWKIEEKRQEIEKRRWEIERGLKTATEKIETSKTGFNDLLTNENILEKKLSAIKNSLKLIYADIIKRTEDQKKGALLQQKIAATERSKTISLEKEKIQKQQYSKDQSPSIENSNLGKIPESFKEKLEKSSETEDEQRKKFLANIDKWSKENKNDQK